MRGGGSRAGPPGGRVWRPPAGSGRAGALRLGGRSGCDGPLRLGGLLQPVVAGQVGQSGDVEVRPDVRDRLEAVVLQ